MIAYGMEEQLHGMELASRFEYFQQLPFSHLVEDSGKET